MAESLFWAALAGEPHPDPRRARTHTAQTLLLIGLLQDEGLSSAELDRFLTGAETAGAGSDGSVAPQGG